MKINFEDSIKLSSFLEEKNSLFKVFWNIGSPTLVEDDSNIKTAAILFDKQGSEIEFVFNKTFYESIDFYTRCFITCHEMLHILLNHGKRMIIHKHDDRSNIAMDLVVNHLLINKFGFDRESLCVNWKDYCWVDTIFENEKTRPLDNKSYEYYYSILENIEIPSSPYPSLMDQHGEMSKDEVNSASNKIYSEITSSDVDDFMKGVLKNNSIKYDDENNLAGSGRGSWFTENECIKIFKRWELAIQKSKVKVLETISPQENWIRENRRLTMVNKGNIFLPSVSRIPTDSLSKEVSNIWFFLDYSGSCISYFSKFISAAKALNKKKFKTKLLTFDTIVQEIEENTSTREIKVYGRGGTDFQCIERYFLENETPQNSPDAIFVITDGFSSSIFKTHSPEKFHWFLTDTSSDKCIPKKSTIHSLSDYC